ncbi:heterokaryon incompatibility protein-domain-containing protein [Podospora australis]|uniref:Heterokaryon incompatibility protein-domain-containing protein n=1 Tax=Podospora australis TaxID=1536484 RepID=A0AAN6WMG3_9PEZI|nr:heterokaryon incompatibility protein-domain-containing protein [Podospora australis]
MATDPDSDTGRQPPLTRSPFAYDQPRLADGQIRLLSQDPLSETLNLRLITTSLDDEDREKYIALSYVWGSDDPSLKNPILVDGKEFWATPGLYAALQALMCRELREKDTKLWVDAICINQADEVEKMAQIRRMAGVYAGAEKVVVFLWDCGEGKGDDGRIGRVLDELERVGRDVYEAGAMLIKEEDLSYWPDFRHLEHKPVERQRLVGVRQAVDNIVERERLKWWELLWKPRLDVGAVALFQRDWFTRVWVVQELVMARSDREGSVVFAVGENDKRIRYEHLWGLNMLLAMWMMEEARGRGVPEGTWWWWNWLWKRLKLEIDKWRTGGEAPALGARAAHTLGARKRYLQGSLDRRLTSWLVKLYVGSSSTALKCRDPEDKIRALRSLAEDGGILDEIMVPGQSWQDLYILLARYFYQEGNIGFLSLCRQRSETLPSWVPDWSQQQGDPWLGINLRGTMSSISQTPALFKAGEGTEVNVFEDNEDIDRVLCVGGFFVDTVQEVGTVWAADPSDRFDWVAAKARIDDIDSFLDKSQMYAPEERLDATWRIIVADMEADEVGQPCRATTFSQAAFYKLQDAIQNLMKAEGGTLAGLDGGWFVYYMTSLLNLYRSRAFLTSKGYVGLCPDTASAGDTIFIPSGAHCPYVIKKRDGRNADASSAESYSTLLGEAYVHGIMNGELQLDQRCNEEEKFYLV